MSDDKPKPMMEIDGRLSLTRAVEHLLQAASLIRHSPNAISMASLTPLEDAFVLAFTEILLLDETLGRPIDLRVKLANSLRDLDKQFPGPPADSPEDN